MPLSLVFFFSLFKRIFSFGVLYLKTIVGKTLRYKLTIAQGKATVRDRGDGSISIIKKPAG